MNNEDTTIKDFYSSHADTINEKRAASPYPLRRYVHEEQYRSILAHVEPGMRVLDAGCGEGNLSILMAQKGAEVVGTDLSEPNIAACKRYAEEAGISNISFSVADLEKLPFEDDSFDLVVSSHVLEHLPDFDLGLKEMARVSKKRFIAAIPTVLSPCSWVQIGQGWFYLKGPRSFLAFFWGLGRMIVALLLGKEGVNEGYGGADVPHVFRFPWIMKQKARHLNLALISYEADSLCLPYFTFLVPVVRWLNTKKASPLLRNFGYGTTYVFEKRNGLTVFANIRVNSPERLQHMKDSFESFQEAVDEWVINVRGKEREAALAFLKERIGKKGTFFELLDDSRGWITNAQEMMSAVSNEYVLIWNEDHVCIAPPQELKEVVQEMSSVGADYLLYSWWQEGRARSAFASVPLSEGTHIDSIHLTPKLWRKVLKAGHAYYLLSLVGVYKKELFVSLLKYDRVKIPLFYTRQLYRFFTLLQHFGLKFDQKEWFHRVNRALYFKLRRYSRETPFDLEKAQDRVEMLPLTLALSKQELFACIDDNLREPGTSLIERGLYLHITDRGT